MAKAICRRGHAESRLLPLAWRAAVELPTQGVLVLELPVQEVLVLELPLLELQVWQRQVSLVQRPVLRAGERP